ncbi:glycosyltransferase family 4 protein [Methanosphaerula subterraneus]|uniref:glycosyltransferase family 4 protein n=1 Tax=Methanosphaerula subterraneus TaxID=3350244 RepID=UPI003F865C93
MGNCNIGIVTFPIGKSNEIPLYNLTTIVNCLANQVYIITGNAGIDVAQMLKDSHFELIYHISGSNAITRIYNYAKTQVTITFHMMKLSKNVDIWIFPIGGEALLPCVFLAKILRKPVIMSLTSSTESMMKYQQTLLTPIVVFFAKFNYFLASKIILYSPALISEWNLEKYRQKILIAYEHFLDFNVFSVTIPLSDRPPLIGYIGRLSKEKGVQNFAQALPAIFSSQRGLRVLIGGDGQLKETIVASLQEGGITTCVDLPGWISHDDLPPYLNQLRLLVLPSYTEGLPNIMLEAMACGTPVLATPVGVIPDVIIDGKTGFIMENNSPECIAMNVIRALNSQELEQIADSGKRFVEENFTFERVVAQWKEVLEEI